MKPSNSLPAFLNEHIAKDGEKVWDEWTFYSNFDLLKKASSNIIDSLEKKNITKRHIDYIVGLSKSGLPLAAYIAAELEIPLVPFSIGEFFSPDGDIIIGLPDYDNNFCRKNILVLDSHIRSAETYKLFKKMISSFQINIVQFGVIADCREQQCNIENFTAFIAREDVNTFLEKNIIVRDDPFFWKHSREHWLIPADNNIDSCTLNENLIPTRERIEIIDKNLKSDLEQYLIYERNKEPIFDPLKFYLDPELVNRSIDNIVGKFTNVKIDTVVACSVIAIPLAMMLCRAFSKTNKNKLKFIFLGNGDEQYFEDKFSSSNKIIFCDDVLATGGLAYNAFKRYIEPKNTSLEAIIVMLSQLSFFGFKDYLCNLPKEVKFYSLT